MNRLTNEELQEIHERVEKASEGSWDIDVYFDYCPSCENEYEYEIVQVQSKPFLAPTVAIVKNKEDAEFIAHAREDILKLLNEIEALRNELSILCPLKGLRMREMEYKEKQLEEEKEEKKLGMSNVHILPDENLGGVLREYVEVDRKANVGDYVYFNDDIDTPEYLKVTGYNHIIDYYKVEHDPNEWEATIEVSCKACRTLEPTNIVHIDGQRYWMVDREAKVGERIIIVNGYGWYRDKVGYIYDVIHPSKYDFEEDDNSKAYVEYEKNAYDDVIHFVRRGNYRVLESIEQ